MTSSGSKFVACSIYDIGLICKVSTINRNISKVIKEMLY